MRYLSIEQQRQARVKGPADSRPFISVIVPVRNESAYIADTLQQLVDQRYDASRFEIIVADGCSTDDTRTIVAALQARYAHLRLLDNPRRWSSAGRNAAVRAARGDIVLLIDGHCQLKNPYYLQNVADAFVESGADCLGRPQPLDVTGANRMQRAIAAARASRLGHHPASHVYSGRSGFVPPQSVAIAYRRSVFDTVGLFDERFDACEDVEFNHRVAKAGLTCWFTPQVQVHYYPRATLSGLFRQMVRYGRGRVRLLRKHPDTFSLPCLVPGAFVLGAVVGPVAAALLPWLGPVYAGMLGLYGVLVALATLTCLLRTRDVRLLPWLPVVFVTVHAGAGCGIVRELVAGARPAEPAAAVEEPAERRRAA